MEIIGFILMGIGLLIALIFGIILIIQAFQTSVLWGLGYLFVPFVAIIFVIMHWDRAGKPFLYGLIAIPFVIGGGLCMGLTASDVAGSRPAAIIEQQ